MHGGFQQAVPVINPPHPLCVRVAIHELIRGGFEIIEVDGWLVRYRDGSRTAEMVAGPLSTVN